MVRALHSAARQSLFRLSPGAGFLVFAAACFLVQAAASATDPAIRDDGAAAEWNVRYPVGNGRLGALPLGDFPPERILLNAFD